MQRLLLVLLIYSPLAFAEPRSYPLACAQIVENLPERWIMGIKGSEDSPLDPAYEANQKDTSGLFLAWVNGHLVQNRSFASVLLKLHRVASLGWAGDRPYKGGIGGPRSYQSSEMAGKTRLHLADRESLFYMTSQENKAEAEAVKELKRILRRKNIRLKSKNGAMRREILHAELRAGPKSVTKIIIETDGTMMSVLYPFPSALPAYAAKIETHLLAGINLIQSNKMKPNDARFNAKQNLTLKNLAAFYYYGVHAHYFYRLNHSFFFSRINDLLPLLGLTPKYQRRIDMIALGLELEEFQDYFIRYLSDES